MKKALIENLIIIIKAYGEEGTIQYLEGIAQEQDLDIETLEDFAICLESEIECFEND